MISKWGDEAPSSSAVGARIEEPKAPRGWGVGRRCPLPTGGKGLGRGLCLLTLSPEKISSLDLK